MVVDHAQLYNFIIFRTLYIKQIYNFKVDFIFISICDIYQRRSLFFVQEKWSRSAVLNVNRELFSKRSVYYKRGADVKSEEEWRSVIRFNLFD